MRRTGLPPNAPYREDGYSVPMEFFKYDPDWRRLVREFQEDLGAGRYDPEWQKQAAQAMEERASGDFDDYKDGQFEEFWGQKQKVHHLDRAGEATQIKLEELVRQGIIKEGDVFSYTRAIGRKEARILIEKDMRVVSISGSVLTMGIPPGRLKYARHLPTPLTTPTKSSKSQPIPSDELNDSNTLETSQLLVDERGPSKGWPNGDEQSLNGLPKENFLPQTVRTQRLETPELSGESAEGIADPEAGARDTKSTPVRPTWSPITPAKQLPYEKSPPPSQAPVEDVILTPIKTLNELDKRIIEIDGRLDHTINRAVSVWRLVRVKRDNQDIGSLFEIRDDYFVRQSPKIVETPQKTRTGRQIRSKKTD